ncbi:MAG: DEAD/DEAH box helicase family protein [Bacteroidetes bacterium]|nr:DEAD/DEAH box helicase family protein [Bacteroidota bacterium]
MKAQQRLFAEAESREGFVRPSIDQLIITSPYKEPENHWAYDPDTRTFSKHPYRREAGYMVADNDYKGIDNPGLRKIIPRVGPIRKRVSAWRQQDYPGVTGITKRLLAFWHDLEYRAGVPFFFCQLEAVETLIWLTEAPESDRNDINIPTDGGDFVRQCAKMATGTGKTVVMSMVIAWQILNKVAHPNDSRFSKDVLIIAPGLTVRDRLAVLNPAASENYYRDFRVVPAGSLEEQLRRGRVLIRNWHALQWETAEKIARRRSVDKRGAKSNSAWLKDVLGDMSNARDILVINDEAHHAWRITSKKKARELSRADKATATKWVGALDRLHRACNIRMCYDFTATPFVPGGKRNSEDALFEWIVSDFGLNDAIEAGLVKTPRVIVSDDADRVDEELRSRLFHIYADDEVKDNLARKADPETPLPSLVTNAYMLLGDDWAQTAKEWRNNGAPTPPVMITIANRTETAARVKYALDHNRVMCSALQAPDKTLHIDSAVLSRAESENQALDISNPTNKQQREEMFRQQVNTVGQVDKPGGHLQNIVSVGMLSEGWDAKTVTHIMGLRAFSSQLLCEQVVGRGLRRTSYELDDDGMLPAEHVIVFGIPFTFLPHETPSDGPDPQPITTEIYPDESKVEYAITWPNVLRVNYTLRPRLSINLEELETLYLDAGGTVLSADVAPVIDGKPGLDLLSSVGAGDFRKIAAHVRLQRMVFDAAVRLYDAGRRHYGSAKSLVVAQIIGLMERILASDRVRVTPEDYQSDPLRRNVTIALNTNRIVEHLNGVFLSENVEIRDVELEPSRRVMSTGDMRKWATARPVHTPVKSHINHCVYDSELERLEARNMDAMEQVEAWAKNDHMHFERTYVHQGVIRKYRPDFLVRLTNGIHLILETKGDEKPSDHSKWESMREWVRAVSAAGRFGRWEFAVSRRPGDVVAIVKGLLR